ncbi:hypothetical protein COOONC_20759, partial [Cooperia oncophora]
MKSCRRASLPSMNDDSLRGFGGQGGPGGMRPGFGGPGGMRHLVQAALPTAPGFGPPGRPGFGVDSGMRPAAPGFGPGARPGGTNLGQTPMPIRRARNVQ